MVAGLRKIKNKINQRIQLSIFLMRRLLTDCKTSLNAVFPHESGWTLLV